jgi:hypothetical protein
MRGISFSETRHPAGVTPAPRSRSSSLPGTPSIAPRRYCHSHQHNPIAARTQRHTTFAGSRCRTSNNANQAHPDLRSRAADHLQTNPNGRVSPDSASPPVNLRLGAIPAAQTQTIDSNIHTITAFGNVTPTARPDQPPTDPRLERIRWRQSGPDSGAGRKARLAPPPPPPRLKRENARIDRLKGTW